MTLWWSAASQVTTLLSMVKDIVHWRKANSLWLNANKTKDMVVDYGTTKSIPLVPSTINAEVVDWRL